MTARAAILAINDLKVSFVRWGQEIEALKGISFSVKSGEWVILAGPNGAGKSVCLRAVCRRLRLSSGRIFVSGDDLESLSTADLAKRVFLVHQDPLLGTAPILTVFENLLVADEAASQQILPKRLLAQKYLELLAPLGLEERLKQPVKTLSGGERQLLTLVTANLRMAPLVLLDEVSAALDPARSRLCLTQLERLHRGGKTLIQVTHNEEHVATLGTRTIVLQAGQITYDESGAKRSLEAIRNCYKPMV